MFHFELYNDERLIKFTRKDKQNMINNAIRHYRGDFPINLLMRVSIFTVISFIPAIGIYFFVDSSFVIPWLSSSCLLISMKFAHNESPLIQPYLDKVLEESNKL